MTDVKRVILVRHARPVIDPTADAASWAIDPSVHGEIERLAADISAFGCDSVVTSAEEKARSTGHLIAGMLDAPVRVDPDLGEQGAGTVPWIADDEAFRVRVIEHFRRPDDRVFGEESSSDAAARFRSSVTRWADECRCPVLVTHGRVLSAYMAAIMGVDPVPFWLDLRMPDAFMVEPDARRWWRIDEEG